MKKTTRFISAALAALVLTVSAAAPASAMSLADAPASSDVVGFVKGTPYKEDEHKNAYISDDGFIYGVNRDGKTCRVINYIGEETDIVIPKKIDGYTVTSIDDYFEEDYMTAAAFAFNDNLKSVTILADIESIFDNSFYKCQNLEKVVLPDSVKRIGDKVFMKCTSLESIDLPKNVKSVGNQFAWDSKWLADKEEKEKLVVICGRLISGRKAEGKVTIPANVEGIGNYAFFGNKKMTELVVSGTCGGIGEYGVSKCKKLKKVTLKNGVTYISNICGISDCPKMETIILPPSLNKEFAGYTMWSNKNNTTYYYYKGTGAEKAFKQHSKTIKTIKGSVLPGKTKSFTVTPNYRSINMKWTKVSTATGYQTTPSGYQIKISTDKKFKKDVKTKRIGKDKTNAVMNGLKSGRKYYVKMRTYKTIDGKKYYGNYTKLRAVKVK